MSHPKGLAEQSFDEPVGNGRAEPTVRPKVMRRPATFSGGAVTPAMPTIHLPPTGASTEGNENLALSAPSLPAVVTLPVKQWQDDLPFGMAMLAILVLVNLALIAWLPHLHAANHAASAATVAMQENIRAVPFGVNVDPSSLTVYEKPVAVEDADGAQDATRMHPPGGADSGPDQ